MTEKFILLLIFNKVLVVLNKEVEFDRPGERSPE